MNIKRSQVTTIDPKLSNISGQENCPLFANSFKNKSPKCVAKVLSCPLIAQHKASPNLDFCKLSIPFTLQTLETNKNHISRIVLKL